MGEYSSDLITRETGGTTNCCKCLRLCDVWVCRFIHYTHKVGCINKDAY